MNGLGQILLIALIQASYDFAGWFIWLGEIHSSWRYYTWKEWTFRIIKGILDFPVTIYLCYEFNIALSTLIIFYIAKWCGVCDFFYLVFRIIWTGKKLFDNANWFNWTPYALYIKLRYGIFPELTPHTFLAQAGIGFLIILIGNFL